MKPLLELPTNPDRRYASWNCTLHRMLAESGMFDVQYIGDVPSLPKKSCGRVTNCLSVVKLDGVAVAIDSWDTDSPSDAAFKAGHFDCGAALGDVRVLLKIQWQPRPLWDEFESTTGIRVYPWTIFPTQEFQLGAFQYDPDAQHIYTATATGADRFGRGEFKEAARAAGDFYAKDGGKKDTLEEYMNVIKSCRWGVSLRGKRGTDGKNRREIEFASCGMPLALNYQPHYPFAFEAGKHYVYMETAEDMIALRDIDPRPFADASREIYESYWSAKGMARLFIDLVQNRVEGS